MKPTLPVILTILTLALLVWACSPTNKEEAIENAEYVALKIKKAENTLSVYRKETEELLLTQNGKPDFRPYLHPIMAPDGKGVLTEYSPGHHKHQTGLYWGFTRLNGRDYFHHPEGDYWKKIALEVIDTSGEQVSWQTVYHLLEESGEPIMEETQIWSMQEQEGKFLLKLEWQGKALRDITIGEYDYGGLFLRMPWKEGIIGEVVNAARQRNEKAEGKRAMWVDVGMQVEGRDDLAHITIYDHPDNKGYPQPWRVDGQLGVGTVRARLGDWSIEKGATEIIRHHIIVHTGELNNMELTNLWESFTGQGSTYSTASLWGLAQEEGLQAKFLTPQEAVDEMTVADGFQVNVWASEPMVTQPMAFCWDDRGRLWIAENRDYESRGKGFSNSGDSRILILEDTDNDGVADHQKVFLEGIPFPAAIAVGFDGLFLGAPPNLLFVPNRNGDDKADVEDIEIRLTGWGIRDRHETINSLHWGPDGWIYGLEGFATPSKIRKPGPEDRLYRPGEPFPEDLLEKEGVDINGGVWRYHPVKDRFEVVAHGFSNPWGIDYDAKGQLFISACVIPHLFHVIPGGIYHRQGGRHFNPYVYSDIQTIVDHRHRSAHGGARVYLSDAFPSEHHGRIFMANIHEHAVLSDVLTPNGSGFIASHGEDFLLANNAQWIGFSMEVGPDGGLYVLDWHDADICGKEVLHKETGRIFRVTPQQSLAENWEGRYDDLKKKPDDFLANLQKSASSWHARRARVILQGRAANGNISEKAILSLKKTFNDHQNGDIRLRAMWALHTTNNLSDQELLKTLQDEDPHLRAWAIQLICEDHDPFEGALSQFLNMAEEDPSAVVRLYLAAALQRMPYTARWAIAEKLVQRTEDLGDHNIPKMIWFGIEPLVAESPEKILAIAGKSTIPVITEFIARRLVDANATEILVAGIREYSRARLPLLTGLNDGLKGRTDMVAPKNWQGLYTKLQSNKKLAALALAIGQQFGDSEAAKQYLSILLDKRKPIDDRREAIVNLAAKQWPELEGHIPEIIKEDSLRIEAIRAIAAFENRELGKSLVEQLDQFQENEKAEALQTLSSRSTYGWLLTEALKNNEIDKKEIPAYVARQLRRVVGNGFVEVWGPIDQLSGQKEAAYAKYTKLLTDEALVQANRSHGRRIFQQSCGACHKMFGEGGNIGPDLTGSNRTNLNYILSNIIEPSSVIQDDYKMVIITTTDGRTYSGNITAEDERQITLRIIGQDNVVISKSTIQAREQSPNSLMPEGILNTLTDEEVIDLIAYLRVSDEVTPTGR